MTTQHLAGIIFINRPSSWLVIDSQALIIAWWSLPLRYLFSFLYLRIISLNEIFHSTPQRLSQNSDPGGRKTRLLDLYNRRTELSLCFGKHDMVHHLALIEMMDLISLTDSIRGKICSQYKADVISLIFNPRPRRNPFRVSMKNWFRT